jgi:hypothetical protein
MSSGTAKDFEGYARDLVKLAQQPNAPPELRGQLLEMAREWMWAAMGEKQSTSGGPERNSMSQRAERPEGRAEIASHSA